MTICAVFFVDLLASLNLVLRRCIGASTEHDPSRGTCKNYPTHRWPYCRETACELTRRLILFFMNVSHPLQSGEQINFWRQRSCDCKAALWSELFTPRLRFGLLLRPIAPAIRSVRMEGLQPREAKHLALAEPFCRQVGETGDAHAVWEPSINGRLD
jgi:hypothetical protein